MFEPPDRRHVYKFCDVIGRLEVSICMESTEDVFTLSRTFICPVFRAGKEYRCHPGPDSNGEYRYPPDKSLFSG